MVIIELKDDSFLLKIDSPTESGKNRCKELIKKIPGNRFSRKNDGYLVPIIEFKSIIRILKNNYVFTDDKTVIIESFNDAIKKLNENLNKYDSKNLIKNINVSNDYSFLKLNPKEYQKIAIEWLTTPKGESQILGGLLADEVGLGKTYEAIAAICKLKKENKCGTGIILCPSSVRLQWGTEINKFSYESFTVIESLPKKRRLAVYENFDSTFMIISYELFRKDVEEIISIKDVNPNLDFSFIILDESHTIKNRERLTYQCVSLLNPPIKILLSATPAKKDISDIFTQFHYINSEIFKDWDYFRLKFLNCVTIRRKLVPISAKQESLPYLHRLIAPYMLRRKSSEVTDEIPELICYDIPIEATEEQNKWFKILDEDAEKNLIAAREAYEENKLNIATFKDNLHKSKYTSFAACSDHLYLLKSSSSKNIQKLIKENSIKDLSSPKVDWVLDFLENNISPQNKLFDESGDKVVIFTQFERMAVLLEDLIVKRFKQTGDVNTVLYTGKMDKNCASLRINNTINCSTCSFYSECYSVEKSKYLFLNDEKTNVIICTDSAQAGVNLQSAKYLINFDLLYSPGDMEQRNGRIRRLHSAHNTVIAYNLYITNSYDEEKIQTLKDRRANISQVIEDTEKEALSV